MTLLPIAMRKRQGGVAAIEFAIILMVLLLFLYGLATFGLAFYTQQVMARSAEDGARAAMLLPQTAISANDARIREVVVNSLVESLVVPAQIDIPRRAWIEGNVTISNTVPSADGSSDIVVSYPFRSSGLLPFAPFAGWIPDTLKSHASVVLRI